MKPYPTRLIARVKALLGYGVPVKVVSRFTDIPPGTLAEWKCEACRAAVEPDQAFIDEVKLALFREIG